MMIRLLCSLLVVGSAFSGNPAATNADDSPRKTSAEKVQSSRLTLQLRYRTETKLGSGRFHTLTRTETWKPSQTAVIVCDMWDLHSCLNATRRGAEMAPRMNRVLGEARRRGVTIIHAPSNCMDYYKDHPARLRAVNTPQADNLPEDIGRWCYKIPAEEQGVYPIDQSNGGVDDDPDAHRRWEAKLKTMGRNPNHPWIKQTDLLDIRNGDYITDKGDETWSILEHNGIENVILVGVHTNMCVLGRPFGLRQMAKNGKNVVLMRDMTDTMYDPKRRPFVSHFTGTDLIVGHIEKYVCPTITSDQLLRDVPVASRQLHARWSKPFRFKNDNRPRLAIVMAESEYRTNETLPKFAVKHLGKHFSIQFVHADPKDRNNIPGLIDAVENADVLFLSIRRRILPKKQLAAIRRHVKAGKPVIGIRTASHAFHLRGKKEPPKGHDDWPEFDAEVFGGNYSNHHGNKVTPTVHVADGAEGHPILAGANMEGLKSGGSLYKTRPLAKTTRTLLLGKIEGKPAEPVAWTNKPKTGNRVFYTSLGHVKEFQSPEYNRFLRNAVYWTAGVKVSDEVKPGY